MSSFNQGMQMGMAAYNMAERNRLAREEMDMARERHDQSMKEGGLRLAGLQRTEDATNRLYEVQNAGVRNQAAIDANNADFDAAVAATGRGEAMPAYVAPQQEFRPATDRDLNRAQMGLAAAKGDMGSMAALTTAKRQLDMSDIAAGVMKMPREEIEKLVPDLNSSGYPILYTGKGKNGYTFLKTEADGKTPIAGSTFTMNESQLRQMALAHKYGEAGFGTEAMDALNKAHKDLGDHVARWNDAMSKTTTANNTATHYGNQDANEATKAQYYANRGQMDRMGSAQYFTGEDGNQYAAIPTMTKQGLQFETVRVNPQGIKLAKMGNGSDGKPIKVEEEGTKMTIGGKLMFADGNGGWIPGTPSGKPKGILPSERGKALKAAGVSDNDLSGLEWNRDGTGVILNGSMMFGLDELSQIPKEIKRLNSSNIQVEEEQKRTLGLHASRRRIDAERERIENAQAPEESNSGFGPKITYRPDYRAPSIYAGPEEWAAYRAFQAQQK